MSIFSTNQAFPEQEQINLLVDQLNRLFSDYEQTENGIIYVGNDDSMPDGFLMQVMDDEDESDASYVSFNDDNAVIGVDNVQDAIEVLAGVSGSGFRMYNDVITASSQWTVNATIAKQGRLAVIDISGSTTYNPSTYPNMGSINIESLYPMAQAPVFSYRRGNTYVADGTIALISTDGSINLKRATSTGTSFRLYGWYVTAK